MMILISRASVYLLFSATAILVLARSDGARPAPLFADNKQGLLFPQKEKNHGIYSLESLSPGANDETSDRRRRHLQSCKWIQIGNDIFGRPVANELGNSVALSADGSTSAVGGEGNIYHEWFFAGEVRIYTRDQGNGSGWVQLGQTLQGEHIGDLLNAADQFGSSVALSRNGSIAAVGAIFNDGNGLSSGHVRVFQYQSDIKEWKQVGSDIDGEAVADLSGFSVALSYDGTILAVGSSGNDGNGSDAGHVRVYKIEDDGLATSWMQMGKDLDGEAADDWFGTSVSLSSDGLSVAVGGRGNNGNGSNAGHVRVFQYDTTKDGWSKVGLDIEGIAAGDYFGASVSLSADGRTVAAGGPQVFSDGKGYAAVYALTADKQWSQLGISIIDGESVGDQFGMSVSLSANGRVLAVGANLNNRNGDDSGNVRVYKLTSTDDQQTGEWIQVGDNDDMVGEAAGVMFGTTVSLSADGTMLAVESRSRDRYARVFGIGESSCILSDDSFVSTTEAPVRSTPVPGPTTPAPASDATPAPAVETTAPEARTNSSTDQIPNTGTPGEQTSPQDGGKGMSTGVLLGATVAAVIFIAMLVGFVLVRHWRRPADRAGRKEDTQEPIRMSSLPSAVPAETAETVQAVLVDVEQCPNVTLAAYTATAESQNNKPLPTFKDQVRGVQ